MSYFMMILSYATRRIAVFYVTRSIREKHLKEPSQDYWINFKQFLNVAQ